jgi:hypothetical protein
MKWALLNKRSKKTRVPRLRLLGQAFLLKEVSVVLVATLSLSLSVPACAKKGRGSGGNPSKADVDRWGGQR